MAVYTVPDISDGKVVCRNPSCGHRDCAATRDEWTDARCCRCGKPLRAGDSFYYGGDPGRAWKHRHECVACAIG